MIVLRWAWAYIAESSEAQLKEMQILPKSGIFFKTTKVCKKNLDFLYLKYFSVLNLFIIILYYIYYNIFNILVSLLFWKKNEIDLVKLKNKS